MKLVGYVGEEEDITQPPFDLTWLFLSEQLSHEI